MVGHVDRIVRQGLADIALGLGHDAGAAVAGGDEALHDLVTGDTGVGSVVPGDVERRQALFGRPHVVADDGDQIVQHHHLAKTRHSLGLAVVDAHDLAAEHRRVGEGGELHTVRQGVDAVLRRAIDLGGRIEAFERPADQAELRGLFQRRIGGRLQAGGAAGQGAIGDAPAAGVVDDLAGFGATARRIDAPAARRRLDQHRPRRRARLAQNRPEGADGIGVSSGLNAQIGVGVEGVAGWRMGESHLRPIGVELLGQDHRDRGVDPLPHLHLRHDQGHLAGGVDPDEGVGREAAAGRVAADLGRFADGGEKANQQATANRGPDLQQRAAGKVGLRGGLTRGKLVEEGHGRLSPKPTWPRA